MQREIKRKPLLRQTGLEALEGEEKRSKKTTGEDGEGRFLETRGKKKLEPFLSPSKKRKLRKPRQKKGEKGKEISSFEREK